MSRMLLPSALKVHSFAELSGCFGMVLVWFRCGFVTLKETHKAGRIFLWKGEPRTKNRTFGRNMTMDPDFMSLYKCYKNKTHLGSEVGLCELSSVLRKLS